MAFKSLSPLVFLFAETLAGVALPALKPAPIALAPQQASNACNIRPRASFPNLCSANLNGPSSTNSVMVPKISLLLAAPQQVQPQHVACKTKNSVEALTRHFAYVFKAP